MTQQFLFTMSTASSKIVKAFFFTALRVLRRSHGLLMYVTANPMSTPTDVHSTVTINTDNSSDVASEFTGYP